MKKSIFAQESITDGVIWRGMLAFFLPIMCGTILQQLYNTADAIIVGQALGKVALAAVGGSATRIIALSVNFFVALASGVSVIISQHFGAGHKEIVKKGIFTGMLLSVFCGIIMTVVGVAFARPILLLMETPPETVDNATIYLRIFFLGMVPSMVYNMGSGILRAMGDSTRPLRILVACVVTNIGLDLLFVLVFRWGIAGAAAATSLSQVLCAVLVLATLRKLPEDISLEWDRELFNRSMLERMISIGLPAGVQSAMFGIANIIIQVGINALGTDTVAGWTAFSKLDDYFWPASSAIGIAVMTYVGQNYGAGRPERVKQAIHQGRIMFAILSLFFTVTICTFRYPLMRLFVGDDPVVVEIGAKICLMSLCYIFCIFMEVYSSAMRGVGCAIMPSIITMIFVCGLRLSYLWLYGFSHLSLFNIALIFPVSWAACSAAFAVYYHSGKWMPRPKPLSALSQLK
ncbi:MAG: MATE family efflux transporter [Oscillospiraceae bacterium]|nr:MATE family efflux transporter [Oscillospiraceae bacterium]